MKNVPIMPVLMIALFLLVPAVPAKAAVGYYGTVNIAKEKTVTAQTNTIFGVPENLIDGQWNTVWRSYQGNPTNCSFVLDLESLYNIGKIDIYVDQAFGYTLSTSTDNLTWTQRFSNEWADPSDTTSIFSYISHLADGAFNARYIKYEAYANWAQFVGCSEIMVYEWLSSQPSIPAGSNGSTNLALNKPTYDYLYDNIPYNTNTTNPSSYAVDGDQETLWLSNSLTWSSEFSRYYGHSRIRIDLGQTYAIGKIITDARNFQTMGVFITDTSDVIPVTNVSFKTYAGMFGTGATTNESVTHNINGVYSGRYVWVFTYNMSSPTPFPETGAAEIQIYEWISTPTPTPQPTPTEPPTAVSLVGFKAKVNGDGSVTLAWETASEVDNAGFNIYRSKMPDGTYKKVNGILIPAQGNGAFGASYSFEDTPGSSGTFYYELEDVDYDGTGVIHGPVRVRVRSAGGEARRRR